MAKAMYNRALSGYTTIQGPSSKQCRQLEDRLQALQVASAESKLGQNEFTEPGIAKSTFFSRNSASWECSFRYPGFVWPVNERIHAS